jgi:hypothetical protein
MAAKVVTFPSRSSKAISELMCVTPAGKMGNCTCGMPKLLPHPGKKGSLLSPSYHSEIVSFHFLSLPMFLVGESGVVMLDVADDSGPAGSFH